MEIALAVLVVLALIVFLGGLTHGITGFGFALVSVTLMLLFVDRQLAVPLALVHGTAINSVLAYQSRKHMEFGRIWPMWAFAIMGVPLGTWVLLYLDVTIFKLVIGAVIAVFGVLFLMDFRYAVKNERAALGPIGLAAGFLNGSVSMSGPPVVLFLANQGARKLAFRANLVATFLVINIATVPAYVAGGIMGPGVWALAAVLLVPAGAGIAAGTVALRHVDERMYRRLALGLVCASGAMLAATAMWAI